MISHDIANFVPYIMGHVFLGSISTDSISLINYSLSHSPWALTCSIHAFTPFPFPPVALAPGDYRFRVGTLHEGIAVYSEFQTVTIACSGKQG